MGRPPKLDWKLGDDPYRWPHGFVSMREWPAICGVEVDPDHRRRCGRTTRHAVHNTQDKT